MPMPLIATDLDGTLLTTGSQAPHPDAIAAVHQAIAAGIPVVFATGRAPVDVLPIAEMVGHRWFAVCNDGAAIVDLRTESVIKTHPMPQVAKSAVIQRLKLKHPDVKFLIDRVRVGAIPNNRAGLVVEEGFEAPWAWALDGAEFVTNIEDALSDPDVVKIAAYVDADGENPAVFYEIKQSTSDIATAVRVHSEKTFVDFSHHGISKATGVQELAQMHGIADADVFAVGDLHNDIEMLGWAGFSFAVANAHPAVHEVADLIVPSNDEGGVAVVIAAAMAHLRLP
jgi:Cof subfamily protein (haloacid dehalogenase superfamily)